MSENVIQYIYGDTNAKISHNRLKWNIKSSIEVPVNQTPGKLGDVIIVTNANVKKVKYVATKDVADSNLQNNSINVYEDFTQPRILVNTNNGFNLYIQSTMQNVMIDGENVIANVYFYGIDENGNEGWFPMSSAYKDALNLNTFTGQDLALLLDTIWGGPELVDSIDENKILPTMIKPEMLDNVVITNFAGKELDVDALWNGVIITDSASLRTSDFNEGENIEIN